MLKKLLISALVITVTAASITISSYAAFVASATISGISFSTGRAELKIFGNIGYTNAGNNGNLTFTLPGPSFEGIGPNWNTDYPLKYMNTGPVYLATSLRAVVTSDEANLADDVMIQVWLWEDVDGNGSIAQGGSDTVTEVGPSQSIASLVSTPLLLTGLASGIPQGLIIRFSTGDLPSETQNKQLTVDFLLDGTTVAATP
ncbi:MAG: hypothetical protein COY81_03605 [Candidatus Pacebacteria bacterium CG_4_10_14_0_8_um_filter_43_12]|nr:MAG: hypothetical protein COY81_03605 [Candidatus Pacebacteria bacterium CG_4_10_14_0_8_um_filter_43_12]